jgi:hypothetical protein
MAKLNQPKDPFAGLPDEFKEQVAKLDKDGLNLKLAEVAKNEFENQKLKAEDKDLNDLKEQVKVASEGYVESTKANKLKVKWLVHIMREKGWYK